MAKRVAVIGAGSSGLVAIKCCLDEGLEPTCFEGTDDIGGLWRFKETPEDGRASIYRSVIMNTSKEMMCFSDFPSPEDFPNYMPNAKVLEYFRMYAKHFNLVKYIRFKTTVCSVKKRPDFSSTGQWDVITETEGRQESAIFDAILVCSGHHTSPNLPLSSFPGIDKFKGQCFHSRDYKDPFEFKGKRIIVIGLGNSGGDLAVELSLVAKQVFISTRKGAWILNRVSENGFPLDVVMSKRYKQLMKLFMPMSVLSSREERKMNARFNHENYGLKPRHRIISQHPTVSDDLPNRIISGKVLVKPNVKVFTETAAVFEDGTKEENIDVIIFATGYHCVFPFFEDSIVKVQENRIPLYKFVFPPHLEKTTVAFIGLIQPLGAIMPVAELQIRWATRVFKGLNKLPSEDVMNADINLKKEKQKKFYVESPRHNLQVDFIDYMDGLAMEIDVKPNLLSLLFKDPKLAKELFFGPCTPYQYRLKGPGKWEKARETILTQRDRIIKPTKTRLPDYDMSDSSSSMPLFLKVVALLLVLAAVFLSF
ncbi:dimethylaniline monooxygenase [N-oxide-forming] 5-like [Microcaecilia unicolor]|uniref:Flavin-containing monooxygenase n=1 Tax=Microcaecilia unicolor TaxID=1415580 RepID=A0A6P7YJH0_9AMPH|nr:dimethylaniline monooxygenase [N-oxide-forming] 5-like [Microcaecilia unicolor]XP_030063090.1 dimethylaniline monooxygenase [N-oxide-forming] 5-like [Microcaecilia unicolor]